MDTVTINSMIPAALSAYILSDTDANSSFLMFNDTQTINRVNTFINTLLVQSTINLLNGNNGVEESTGIYNSRDYCALKGYYEMMIN